jgi:endonuclease/exonuclease/phosphatase family metal-dependent hydrolase
METPEQHHAAFRNVLEPPYPGTFHGFQGGAGRRCIDWILYRGAITARRARVLSFQVDSLYPSDHYPVAADFFWDT